jgi:hypothetical protein
MREILEAQRTTQRQAEDHMALVEPLVLLQRSLEAGADDPSSLEDMLFWASAEEVGSPGLGVHVLRLRHGEYYWCPIAGHLVEVCRVGRDELQLELPEYPLRPVLVTVPALRMASQPPDVEGQPQPRSLQQQQPALAAPQRNNWIDASCAPSGAVGLLLDFDRGQLGVWADTADTTAASSPDSESVWACTFRGWLPFQGPHRLNQPLCWMCCPGVKRPLEGTAVQIQVRSDLSRGVS